MFFWILIYTKSQASKQLWNSESLETPMTWEKNPKLGQGDDSADKLFAMQARWAEFTYLEPWENTDAMVYISNTGTPEVNWEKEAGQNSPNLESQTT